jgi:alkaline phosphatase D
MRQFTRRDFLKYSLATSVVVWGSHELPHFLNSDQARLFEIDAAQALVPLFPQSVASGDPQPSGIILWTRVAEQTGSIQVAFQVASDRAFTNVVLSGIASTDASKDYTTKVQLSTPVLTPYTTYYYRFIFNGASSNVGRFKTLPSPNASLDKVRFGYISCQDYTNGYYNALRYLADENIDFVVHLGDYIYETAADPSFQTGQVRNLVLPSGKPAAAGIQDYRFLYQTYNSDPDMRKLRENFAFITIWDDHEFANDSYKSNTPDQNPPLDQGSLRQQANQAWAEYTPASVTFYADRDPLSSLLIYRSFVFGDLFELIMTDERLYRDGPPCGLASGQRSLTPGCPDLGNAQRTMLGSTQKRWFLAKLRNSSRIWKIWGNEVMTMQLKVLSAFATQLLRTPVPDLFVTLDQWDGYPVERAAIFQAVKDANIKNFVTITGDLHTFVTGYQRVNFNNPAEAPVGVEFVVGSVTSSNFSESGVSGPTGAPLPPIDAVTQVLRLSNPHITYFNSATHGYNVIEVGRDALICTVKAVSTVTSPTATLSTLKTFRVLRDQVLIQEIDTPIT